MKPLEFLEQAIRTPSPSGYEEPIQKLISEYLQPHTDEVSIDVHGNLTACVGPADSPRLMLAGHCDQIGMLISYIDEEGFLYAQTIGGWDPQQLIGQAMTVWTANGPVSAVISRKPIHLLSAKEREEVVRLQDMWLDIGAANAEEAAAKVRVGDPVTLDLHYRPLLGDFVSGPGMDNKTGMWTVMETVRRSATELKEKPLQCQLFGVATVQEEIGLRGAKTAAARISPDVAIAVDVTHASDCPTISKQQQGDIRLGGGPVIVRGPNINAKVAARLIELAEENDIPYQLAALGRAAPNDSNVLQISGAGVATGLVAVPNRYMHSAVETISTADIEAIANLLTLFAQSLTPECSFIPG
ncbi:M42 family metallopeptidase [Rhodopirellula sallentina]|uniref:Peptidase m42 family protein n=1 Tax=Rhodopirellula sallentina SM41 TaxID=1263870 RepID=M5UI24_9BACT|nr:M42 family metallopeptidase [Rhodopirellula sallentina]EMI55668.1 peptidase m42 family protein [Rhodopirellula sallentina SM41]